MFIFKIEISNNIIFMFKLALFIIAANGLTSSGLRFLSESADATTSKQWNKKKKTGSKKASMYAVVMYI